MKWTYSVQLELDDGRHCAVVMDIDWSSDWNALKDCKVLLEDWAKTIQNQEEAA